MKHTLILLLTLGLAAILPAGEGHDHGLDFVDFECGILWWNPAIINWDYR